MRIIIYGVIIVIAILTSGYIAYQFSNAHSMDCFTHKKEFEQLRKTFGNNGTLNGQLVPQIVYLNQNCSDLGMGNISVYLER